MELKQRRAYELYKSGMNQTQIAKTLGITRQTVSNYKKRFLWSETLLSEHSIDANQKEREFILELIKEWDIALEELKASDMKNKLLILERYTKLYYKLKNINANTAKTQKLKKEDIAADTLKAIGQIAIGKKELPVANFLSLNTDQILGVVLGN